MPEPEDQPAQQTQSDAPPPPTITQPDASLTALLPCISCNYNLTGLPHHGTCPECAAPIQLSLPAALRSSLRVFCVKCRYDLSTLPIERPCPECGTPINDSLRWLVTLRMLTNTRTIRQYGAMLACLGIVLYVASIWLGRFQGVPVGLFLGLIATLIGLYLTTKLPDRWLPSSLTWHYTTIRTWAVIIAISGFILTVGLCIKHHAPLVTRGMVEISLSIASIVFCFAHLFVIVSVIQFHLRLKYLHFVHPL